MSITTNDPRGVPGKLVQLIALIAFGFATLGFCIAIDHPEWFRIRPATGTAIAMSNAAGPGQAADGDAAAERRGGF